VQWVTNEPELEITDEYRGEHQTRWGKGGSEKTKFPRGVAFCWTQGCPRYSVRWSWKGEIFTLAILAEDQGCAAAMLADCVKVWFGPWRIRGDIHGNAGKNLNFGLERAEFLIKTCPRINEWLTYCEQVLVEECSIPSRDELVEAGPTKEKRITLSGELMKEMKSMSSQIGELTKKVDELLKIKGAQ
jgi:hypothetical protein